MKPEWELLPRIGLGPVRFGMTRDKAVAAGAIFGAVTHEHDQPQGDDMFEILAPFYTEDEVRAHIAAIKATAVD